MQNQGKAPPLKMLTHPACLFHLKLQQEARLCLGVLNTNKPKPTLSSYYVASVQG